MALKEIEIIRKINELSTQMKALEKEQERRADYLLAHLSPAAQRMMKKFDENIEELKVEKKSIEEVVVGEVVKFGATVKGDGLTVAFCDGRLNWDTKMLDELIEVYPDIAQAKKKSAAYASIRRKGLKVED